MTHHTDETQETDEPRDTDAEGGRGSPGVEQLVLRTLLLALLGLSVAAVIGSLDDIRRYVRIKRM